MTANTDSRIRGKARREEHDNRIIWDGRLEALIEAGAIDRATFETWVPPGKGRPSAQVQLPNGRLAYVRRQGDKYQIHEHFTESEMQQRLEKESHKKSDEALELLARSQKVSAEAISGFAEHLLERAKLFAASSPARFEVGDEALRENGDRVVIDGAFGMHPVIDKGEKPGYICRDWGSTQTYFIAAGGLWDADGNIRHLRRVVAD